MKLVNRKFWISMAVAGCASASLTACFPLVVGGAAVGGLVATDRRASGTYLNDEGIELRSSSRIRDSLGERGHVNVTSYNTQVLLTGEVPSAQDKQLVEQIVRKVANDVLLGGKIKASLVDARDLFANAFKVVTERGTTYLMGRVTQREANRATDIARSTSGVQRVVRVFEIITEEELQGLMPAEPPKK